MLVCSDLTSLWIWSIIAIKVVIPLTHEQNFLTYNWLKHPIKDMRSCPLTTSFINSQMFNFIYDPDILFLLSQIYDFNEVCTYNIHV